MRLVLPPYTHIYSPSHSCIPLSFIPHFPFRGDLSPDALSNLYHAMSPDVRWQNLVHMPSKRDIMTLQHLAIFATGCRNTAVEHTSIERRFYSQILEKTLK